MKNSLPIDFTTQINIGIKHEGDWEDRTSSKINFIKVQIPQLKYIIKREVEISNFQITKSEKDRTHIFNMLTGKQIEITNM